MFEKRIPKELELLGFKKYNQRHFVHPDCSHLFLEFTSGFLEIGEDSDITPDEIDVDGVKIKILSPTDCVKDRLASFIHFKAREAVIVAEKHPIDLEEVKRWCIGEQGEKHWEEFLEKIKS